MELYLSWNVGIASVNFDPECQGESVSTGADPTNTGVRDVTKVDGNFSLSVISNEELVHNGISIT